MCALHVTDTARGRILKAGGQIMTFDQLALKSPKGQKTVVLQGLFVFKLNNHFLNLILNFLNSSASAIYPNRFQANSFLIWQMKVSALPYIGSCIVMPSKIQYGTGAQNLKLGGKNLSE